MIPKPNEGETLEQFTERFMSDPKMMEEYPDQEQRMAVCKETWEKSQETAGTDTGASGGEQKLAGRDAGAHSGALECRFGGLPLDVVSGAVLPEEIMYMPGGVRYVTPSQGGTRPVRVNLLVDARTAEVMQETLDAHSAAGQQKPWFDFDHQGGAASAWPRKFVWRESPVPGVYSIVQWSKPGAEAVSGKSYRAFSPRFFVDDVKGKPARVTGAPLNMGGLENDPAFADILPLWAKNARGENGEQKAESRKQKAENMTDQELAVIEAKLETLETENAELRSKVAGSEVDQALTAKEAEISGLKTQLQAAETVLQARRTADAKAAVQAAVARGAIPPKDEALQAKWTGLVESNPDHAELLAKLPGNPALKTVTESRQTEISLTREDYNHVLRGYLDAKTPMDRGLIYRADIHPRLEKGEIIPFHRLRGQLLEAAGGDNVLGTLVGNIISQRTLSLVVSRRPMLKDVITDFSNEQAVYGQAVYTRTVGLPTVATFGGTKSDRADTDYTVTLNQFKEVRYTILATEYGGTGRDLVKEHAEANAVALGNSMVDALAALIDDTFTSETVKTAANHDYTAITTYAKTLNAAGIPDTNRYGWVNSDVAEALLNDELMIANFDGKSESAYGHWTNVKGFANIWEFPGLPGNSVNVIAWFAHANALLIASRVPIDPTSIISAGYPGKLQTVTDPVTGLSVLSNQWVVQDTLAVNDRLICLYGVDEGIIACGHKVVSA